MKVQKILRILVNGIVCFFIGRSLGDLIMGKNDLFDNILLITSGAVLLIYIARILRAYIKIYISMREVRMLYKVMFNALKITHRARYKCYFSSDKDKIEEYTEAIEKAGNDILEIGERWLEIEFLPKKMEDEFHYIMEKTRYMLSNDKPICEYEDETSN